jgi:hypothetical protein
MKPRVNHRAQKKRGSLSPPLLYSHCCHNDGEQSIDIDLHILADDWKAEIFLSQTSPNLFLAGQKIPETPTPPKPGAVVL